MIPLPGADARADHPALVTPHGIRTWAELRRDADTLARRLRRLGVEAGDRVATLLGNDPLFVDTVHALWRLDATLVPLNHRLTAGELSGLLADARPRLLIATDALAETARAAAADTDLAIVTPDELARSPEAGGPLVRHVDPANDHAILFTSGTTGRPKGVRLTLANQLASAAASAERLGVRDDDRWLCAMPLHHVGGLAIVLRGAVYGTTTLLHERFDAADVARALRDERVSLVSLVPTMLQRVLEQPGLERAPSALRVVLLGGGPIPPALLADGRARGIPVAPTYGLTEAASQVATLAPEEAAHADSAGRALPGTTLRIVDDDGKPVGFGEPGQILVRGPQVMAGYLDRPEDDARRLRDGWLHTGDVGTLDAAGYLRVLERRTDLIVSGGENVYPAEVEAALLAHPDVAEAGVVARTDPTWGQRVHAVIVERAGAHVDATALDAWLRERLAGFKRPRSYDFAKALPRTASGKLRRGALRAASRRGLDDERG